MFLYNSILINLTYILHISLYLYTSVYYKRVNEGDKCGANLVYSYT